MPKLSDDSSKKESERFLGIYFKCCNVYARIYKNKDGTAYQGFCPKCGRMVHVPIGEQGTDARIFIAE